MLWIPTVDIRFVHVDNQQLMDYAMLHDHTEQSLPHY